MAQDLNVQVGQQIPGFVEMMQDNNAAQAFPSVIAALNNLILMYAEVWKSVAMGSTKLPGQPRVLNMRGAVSKYVQSIAVETDQPFTKVVKADGKITDEIENGSKEIDLKTEGPHGGLLGGPKHREGANGPFNIVAFRHGAPGSQRNPMPMNVYNVMKKKDPSTAQSIKNGRQEYSWGGRLSQNNNQGQRTKLKTDQARESLEKRYQWVSGKYAGMVKMQDVTSKAKSAQYLTFRCVSRVSDPNSWILPAKPGMPIREMINTFMRPFVEDQIRKAFEEDIKR